MCYHNQTLKDLYNLIQGCPHKALIPCTEAFEGNGNWEDLAHSLREIINGLDPMDPWSPAISFVLMEVEDMISGPSNYSKLELEDQMQHLQSQCLEASFN